MILIKKLFSIIKTSFMIYDTLSNIKQESAVNIDKIEKQMDAFINSLQDDATKKLIPLFQLLKNQLGNL